jgi:predicted RNA-binding Zn ribbon-like protein
MTGETTKEAEAQLGGRDPAPGRLALVQAFLNSRWDLSQRSHPDLLQSPEALAEWLGARGLVTGTRPLADRDLSRCLAVREGLRGLAFANNGQEPDHGAIEAMRREAEGAGVRILVGLDGPEFLVDEQQAGVDGAIAALLAISARAMIDGRWRRFKACPGRGCGWVFYDHSRNQSGRWCSMSVCGGREKARAYYRRKTAQGSRARGQRA